MGLGLQGLGFMGFNPYMVAQMVGQEGLNGWSMGCMRAIELFGSWLACVGSRKKAWWFMWQMTDTPPSWSL